MSFLSPPFSSLLVTPPFSSLLVTVYLLLSFSSLYLLFSCSRSLLCSCPHSSSTFFQFLLHPSPFQAKLGNSWVSPNVGHLILKYLCPALTEVLGDGLKAYVLDLIIGQRRNQPWSLVEASTQLGMSGELRRRMRQAEEGMEQVEW